MDILEAKQDESYRESERRERQAIADWNEQVKKGKRVKGNCMRFEAFKPARTSPFDGPTTSKAYYEFPNAVVDVKGRRKVPLYELQKYFKTRAFRF